MQNNIKHDLQNSCALVYKNNFELCQDVNPQHLFSYVVERLEEEL